jgi:hypothetical protein
MRHGAKDLTGFDLRGSAMRTPDLSVFILVLVVVPTDGASFFE